MAEKPAKPYPEFPLFPHDSGQWAKKIHGKTYYFGIWGKPNDALEEYHRFAEGLKTGRRSRERTTDANLRALCRRFLYDKQLLVESGELSSRSFNDYADTCKRLVAYFGKSLLLAQLDPADFTSLRASLAEGRGPTWLANEINRVRTIFRYAAPDRANLVAEPIRFGPVFRRPTKKSQRIHKAKQPSRMVAPHEIQRLASVASPQLRAMIWLAVNCGMGNSDCSQLRIDHIDLDGGWLDYPRPKTGVGRRAQLWPETIRALRVVIDSRPKDLPPAATHCVFVTRYRKPWRHDGKASCPISGRFGKLTKLLGINRVGLSFYSLRHTFQTVAKRCGDVDAVRSVMGHVDGSISAVYDEEFCDDKRLLRVSQTVHDWLELGSRPHVASAEDEAKIIKFRSAVG